MSWCQEMAQLKRMEIHQIRFDSLEQYMRVPIAFEVRWRLLIDSFEVTEVQQPWIKDYDAYPDEGPRSYASRFDVSSWGLLAAFDGFRILGGIMLAFRCPAFELLE